MHNAFPALSLPAVQVEGQWAPFQSASGGGEADKLVLSRQLGLCIEDQSRDFRGDWTWGLALTMGNNATNPTRPFGRASHLSALGRERPSDGASS